MTSTQPLELTVLREHRTDRAERTLAVSGAPHFSYQTQISYRNRGKKTVTWAAKNIRFTWDRGVLEKVHVGGVKLKTDGTEGALRASATYGVEHQPGGGMTLAGWYGQDHREGPAPAPDWVTALAVAQAGNVPPFKALDEVGA